MTRGAGSASCTIIVPVLQEASILDLFLDSLVRTVEVDSHVILINDGSGPGAASLLDRFASGKHDRITAKLISHETPRGCAAALNEGISRIRGETVFFADSDLILLDGWQRHLIAALEAVPNRGAAGALLLYPQTGGVQHCGLAFSEDIGRHLFLNALPDDVPDTPFGVQAVAFALCAVSSRAVEQCGPLDEEFFNGYEDLDYMMRVGAAGFGIVMAPAARAYHWERSNGPHRSTNRKRNLGRFWSRWGSTIRSDLFSFSAKRLHCALQGFQGSIRGIDLCRDRVDAGRLWRALSEVVPLKAVDDRSFALNGLQEIWLPQTLGRDGHRSRERLLIAADNFVELVSNRYWLDIRRQFRDDDLVVDLYGNVLPLAPVIGGAWPGAKIR